MTYRASVDINCDMGEAFGAWRLGEASDEELMPLVTSANVATGFHAGDPVIMDRAARLARRHGVGLGAHPGYADLQGFGRRTIRASPEELVADVVYQTGAMREVARRHGLPLQHVKLHGALHMDAAADEALSRAHLEALQAIDPSLLVFCMHWSRTYAVARELGQPVVREFYADRDYDRAGSIVFARKVARLEPARVAEKVLRACREGRVTTVDGEDIEVPFESICFHSDTPGALEMARAIRAALDEEGIRVLPVTEVLAAG